MSEFKIATWNVNSLRVREQQVIDWLTQHQPDALCLQETKLVDAEFPLTAITEAGYHCEFEGQKTYNGVAILSKAQPQAVSKGIPNFEDDAKRYIAVDLPFGEHLLRLINVYVPNGQALDSDKFLYKRKWFDALRNSISADLGQHGELVLVGDFNITPTDLDVHDPIAWKGKIHCSDTERLMLQTLMASGLYDTFRQHNQAGEQFSWWDYRGAGYRANAGLRIDLILSSAAMLARSHSCVIDEQPRKHERPSDHTPVVATYTM